MNSVQLLAWLVSVWEKVVNFFQTLYNWVSWAVNNLITLIGDWIIDWYNAAIDWAAYYINILRDEAALWFEEAKAQALANLINLLDYLLEIINNHRDWLLEIITNSVNWLLDVIGSVYDWASASYDNAKAWVANAISNVTDVFIDLAGWVINKKDDILDIISYFSSDNRRALLTALFDNASTILLFLSNPLRFIIDIIYNSIIDLLQDALADGLGTVETELPPRKTIV